MKYKPDYKLKKAQKLIKSLDDSENNELIKYFIKKQDEHIEKQKEKIKEYRIFFKKLKSFIN